jgi:hypothetical protein
MFLPKIPTIHRPDEKLKWMNADGPLMLVRYKRFKEVSAPYNTTLFKIGAKSPYFKSKI